MNSLIGVPYKLYPYCGIETISNLTSKYSKVKRNSYLHQESADTRTRPMLIHDCDGNQPQKARTK